VLEIRGVVEPHPGDNHVRVRVHATTVTSGDSRTRGAISIMTRSDPEEREQLLFLKPHLEEGAVHLLVDRVYAFEELPAAYR